jgi:hypothetical protein
MTTIPVFTDVFEVLEMDFDLSTPFSLLVLLLWACMTSEYKVRVLYSNMITTITLMVKAFVSMKMKNYLD